MKKCYSCNKTKALTEYHSDISRTDGYSNKCKYCRCKYSGVTSKKCVACSDMFPVTDKNKGQKYCGIICQRVHLRFGIDEYQLEDLLIRSDYKCAICGNAEMNIDKRTGYPFELSIDHDHKTGNVRGVLCTNCNTGLGCLKDDINILEKAIQYLRDSQSDAIKPKLRDKRVYKKLKITPSTF